MIKCRLLEVHRNPTASNVTELEQCFKVWNYYLGSSRKFLNTCLMSDLLLPFLCYNKWSPELLKRVPRHICSWSVMLLVQYMSSELSMDVLSQDSCFSSVHSWHLTCSFICCWVNQRRMIVYNGSVRERHSGGTWKGEITFLKFQKYKRYFQ